MLGLILGRPTWRGAGSVLGPDFGEILITLLRTSQSPDGPRSAVMSVSYGPGTALRLVCLSLPTRLGEGEVLLQMVMS